ncbi:MAG: DUF4404 family protein [Elusimicrobiota bacterium]|nr:DUF4404 family protein [Elusimicrobiota bacterium]
MIEETVAKIEAALRAARGDEPEKKAQLIALLEQLKAEVQREKASKDIIAKAEQGLKDAAVEFDVTHPQLAAIVGEISAMLAKIGI